jgi:Asp-tRNA(Asn)/Glu-tRNA(Gln) amidotransferase A subunit family amidase
MKYTQRTTIIKNTLSAIKKHNPVVNAVVSINPDLNSYAEEIQQQQQNKVLYNVPFFIKDCYYTQPSWPTTCGSPHIQQLVQTVPQAPVIDKLIKAGAIPIAKTNTSEFCMDIQVHLFEFNLTVA